MMLDLNMLLDITKVGVGLIYLALEYYARREMWIASVVMPIIGMILFYNKGLYADFGINIYYLVIAVYGWITWRSGASKSGASDRPISHIPWRAVIALLAGWLAVWGLIAWVLASFTDSTVVALDSFTTSLSIVGMWMLARKYVEQWIVWFVVDAVYVYLYYYKGIYFSGTLYLFYTIMAVAGYRKWMGMMRSAAA